ASGVPTSGAPASAVPASAGPASGAVPATAPPYPHNLDESSSVQWAGWQPPRPRGHAEYGESPAPRVAPVPPSADPSGSPAVDPPDAGAVHLPGTAPVDQSAEALGVPQADAPDVPPADQPKRTDGLPQRVPGEPDVPALPEAVAEDGGAHAGTPELDRIATYIRHDAHVRHDYRSAANDGTGVDARLAALGEGPGVRDAELRGRPGRAHTLRLDLADGAAPAQVSREVARL